MGTIVKPNTFSAGATIIAAEHNSNFDDIYNEFNGNINNANIKASAGIVGSKLDLTASAVDMSISNSFTAYAQITDATITNSFTTYAQVTDATISNLGVSVIHASLGNSTGTDGQILANSSGSNTTWVNAVTTEGVLNAWVHFDGTGTGAIQSSLNVSSIVKNGTGNYTVNWDTNFGNVSYSCVVSSGERASGPGFGFTNVGSIAVGSVEVVTGGFGGSSIDVSYVTVHAIGV